MGGGQIIYTEQVDNYPGLPGINGFELAQKLEQHARELSVPSQSAEVVRVEKEGDNWKIILDSGAEILTQTVLLATGASHRKLGVPDQG